MSRIRDPRAVWTSGLAPRAVLAALCVVAGGCVSQPLLARALRARGGESRGLLVRSEARVYAGVPGTWETTRASLDPDLYGWKIITAADPIYLLFDGTTSRSFVGAVEVASDASPSTPLRSHARWTAVVNLRGLDAPGVVLSPLAAAELPDGVREGLLATFPDGATFRLGFDDRALLVWARGPLDLSPFMTGEISARFADPRRVGRLLVPFTTSYALDDETIADERALAICIDPAGLTPASFHDPALLPDCR